MSQPGPRVLAAGPRVLAAVLGKDLRLDLRSRDRLGHMAMFAALVVVLLGLTLPTSQAARAEWIPALLWIVFFIIFFLMYLNAEIARLGSLTTFSGCFTTKSKPGNTKRGTAPQQRLS